MGIRHVKEDRYRRKGEVIVRLYSTVTARRATLSGSSNLLWHKLCTPVQMELSIGNFVNIQLVVACGTHRVFAGWVGRNQVKSATGRDAGVTLRVNKIQG